MIERVISSGAQLAEFYKINLRAMDLVDALVSVWETLTVRQFELGDPAYNQQGPDGPVRFTVFPNGKRSLMRDGVASTPGGPAHTIDKAIINVFVSTAVGGVLLEAVDPEAKAVVGIMDDDKLAKVRVLRELREGWILGDPWKLNR